MSVSLDGYVAGPGGEIDWGAPDDELHRFHNARVSEVGVQLMGRRLYQTMLYWETADQDPDLGATQREFSAVWHALPKVVFSTTLTTVEGANTRLATGGLAEEIARLKAEPGDGDIAIGGAELAAAATELGLIDQYELFVNPVVLGGGTPFFPRLDHRIDLELADTRTFGSRVVLLRYQSRP